VKDHEVDDELARGKKNLADPRSGGVTVTIIDLGLARMDDAGDDTKQRWTELDPEIFEGEGVPLSFLLTKWLFVKVELGDYQYDVYRMMRAHNEGEWGTYHPLTNVMVSLPFLKSHGLWKALNDL
jgi:serine/threonine-protein kinase haspin